MPDGPGSGRLRGRPVSDSVDRALASAPLEEFREHGFIAGAIDPADVRFGELIRLPWTSGVGAMRNLQNAAPVM